MVCDHSVRFLACVYKTKMKPGFDEITKRCQLIKTGVSIHIVKRHIISVALVALIGLMMPSLAIAADFAHGE